MRFAPSQGLSVALSQYAPWQAGLDFGKVLYVGRCLFPHTGREV